VRARADAAAEAIGAEAASRDAAQTLSQRLREQLAQLQVLPFGIAIDCLFLF